MADTGERVLHVHAYEVLVGGESRPNSGRRQQMAVLYKLLQHQFFIQHVLTTFSWWFWDMVEVEVSSPGLYFVVIPCFTTFGVSRKKEKQECQNI
jgi:hypothetical protein